MALAIGSVEMKCSVVLCDAAVGAGVASSTDGAAGGAGGAGAAGTEKSYCCSAGARTGVVAGCKGGEYAAATGAEWLWLWLGGGRRSGCGAPIVWF